MERCVVRTGGLTNTGTISAGGSLDVLGPVTQNATVSTQTGSTIRFFGPVSGPGSYTGTGTVMFLNTFSPGASPAAVNFAGNVVFAGSSELVIELAGTAPGTQYDTLNIAGSASIGGTLNVDLLDGFVPDPGNVFQILSASGGVSGTFSEVQLPTLESATWQLHYNPNSVVLQVGLAGDYNRNGNVDAADYVLWRKTLGQTGAGLAADGNGNNQIDADDYSVWRANFGRAIASGSVVNAAVPEPNCLLHLAAGSMLLGVAASSRRHYSPCGFRG